MKLEDAMTEWAPMQKGQILLLTGGSYSAFGVSAAFKVIADFDPQALLNKYREGKPKARSIYAFWIWLLDQKVIEEVHYREFWFGE